MVKVGKLWGDAKFARLSPISKLIYCYLISQPSITTLGILVLDLNKLILDLKIDNKLEDLEDYLLEIKGKKYVDYFYCEEEVITLLVIGHYHSLPRSKATVRKALKEGQSSKGDMRSMLLKHFTEEDFEINSSFKPPTPKEVSDYALSLGYLLNGKDFVEYYGDNDWYDRNDKKVRDWKAKVRKVWCKEDRKLETASGAPEGFEYFFVEIEEGHRIYPQSWIRGLPSHSNHIYAQYLIDEFTKINS